MPQKINLSLENIQHVGIPVTNIKNSETFYTNLGFKNIMQANFIHDNETGICIMMKQGNIIIELYQMPGKALQLIAARKDGHVDHIAFDVSDIDKTFSILSEAGYHILEHAPVYLNFWDNGCKYFNIVGPDNERLEFNQVL
jgi:catechol 2,3-dioxygenase-like lactoylglutathione lyase family enzyme